METIAHISERDWKARLREIRRNEREASDAFRSAVAAGDRAAFVQALRSVEMTGSWRRAFEACRELSAPASFRKWFLGLWQSDGDSLRTEVGDDLVLIDALRAMLPKYRGSALTIYRGDSWENRRRRTYGLSWSTERPVGDVFARDRRSKYVCGTVLLTAEAPPEAVLCLTASHSRQFREECEVLVDRRRLSRVRVLARYAADIPDPSE